VGCLTTLSTDRLYSEGWYNEDGKGLKASGHGLMEALSRNILEGLRKSERNLSHYILCLERDSNQAPPENGLDHYR
jgi:hypothetical protein